MILIKNNLECVITLNDPNNILAKDRNNIILNILKENHKKKI